MLTIGMVFALTDGRGALRRMDNSSVEPELVTRIPLRAPSLVRPLESLLIVARRVLHRILYIPTLRHSNRSLEPRSR